MISVLLLRNQFSEIRRLAAAVKDLGREHSLSEAMVGDIRLALEEVVTNIIMHGYDDDEEHEIELRFAASPERIAVTVLDDARAFNPLDHPEPKADANFDELEIGGIGILLIRRVMDHVEYTREGGRNVLVLAKRLTVD